MGYVTLPPSLEEGKRGSHSATTMHIFRYVTFTTFFPRAKKNTMHTLDTYITRLQLCNSSNNVIAGNANIVYHFCKRCR